MRYGVAILLLPVVTAVTAQQPASPRQQPGATITMFGAGAGWRGRGVVRRLEQFIGTLLDDSRSD